MCVRSLQAMHAERKMIAVLQQLIRAAASHPGLRHVLQASGKYDLKNPFYRQLTQPYMPTQAYASDMQSTGLPEAEAAAGYEGQDPTQQAWLYQQAQTQQQVQQASPAHQWPGEPV